MRSTATGNFGLGFRQGWTPWFKDLGGLTDWAVSNDIGVIDLGGDCRADLPLVTGKDLKIGSVDLLAWHDLISADAQLRSEAVEKNREFIADCAKFGVRNYFAVMLPKDPSLPRAENFGFMLESLNLLAPILAENNGRIVIEGWPGPGALCCTPEGYRAALEQTPKEIGINFDPSHLVRMGIDPLRFVGEFTDRIYHVHGKDCFIDGEALYQFGFEQPATFAKNHDFGNAVWRYTIPGEGDTNWQYVLTILKAKEYDGFISIELEDENYNGTEEGEKKGILSGISYLSSL